MLNVGNEFEQHLYHTKIFNISTRVPRCIHCYPIAINSFKEIELKEFCKQYYPNLIENDRQLIKPHELDIVVPELKLAIEFNRYLLAFRTNSEKTKIII